MWRITTNANGTLQAPHQNAAIGLPANGTDAAAFQNIVSFAVVEGVARFWPIWPKDQ